MQIAHRWRNSGLLIASLLITPFLLSYLLHFWLRTDLLTVNDPRNYPIFWLNTLEWLRAVLACALAALLIAAAISFLSRFSPLFIAALAAVGASLTLLDDAINAALTSVYRHFEQQVTFVAIFVVFAFLWALLFSRLKRRNLRTEGQAS